MLRRLYDWMMALAAGRHARTALAAVSFAESSFFPIPPDVMLIPMVLANKQAWWRIALVCTLSSVAGALLGYAIGYLLYESIGQQIIAFYNGGAAYERLVEWYDQWGALGVLAGAVTPLPYKILTIFSGSVGFALPIFIVVSIVGRGLRFFIVAGLLYWFGDPIRRFIETRLTLVLVTFTLMVIGGFVAVKFLI